VFVKEVEESEIKRGKVDKMRSDCEEFLINLNRRLENDTYFNLVMTEKDRTELPNVLNETEVWFDSIRDKVVEFDEFAGRFKLIRRLVYDVQVRAGLFEKRGQAFGKLNETIEKADEQIEELATNVTETWKLERLKSILNETRNWFREQIMLQESALDAGELRVLPGEVDEKRIDLERWINMTVSPEEMEEKVDTDWRSRIHAEREIEL
jgi:hypothetical protein